MTSVRHKGQTDLLLKIGEGSFFFYYVVVTLLALKGLEKKCFIPNSVHMPRYKAYIYKGPSRIIQGVKQIAVYVYMTDRDNGFDKEKSSLLHLFSSEYSFRNSSF